MELKFDYFLKLYYWEDDKSLALRPQTNHFNLIPWYLHPYTSLATHKEEKGKFMILINGHHKRKKKEEIILLFIQTSLFLLTSYFFFFIKARPNLHKYIYDWRSLAYSQDFHKTEAFFPVNQLFDYGFLSKWKLFLFISFPYFLALLDRKTFSAIGKDFEIIIWLLMRKLNRRKEIFIP